MFHGEMVQGIWAVHEAYAPLCVPLNCDKFRRDYLVEMSFYFLLGLTLVRISSLGLRLKSSDSEEAITATMRNFAIGV